MIVLALLLIGALMLPIAAVLVCVWVIHWLCTPPARRPAPVVPPSWQARTYVQNVNSIWTEPGFGWVRAPETVWPAVWVSPATPTERGEPVALQIEPWSGQEFWQQRRQLSEPARRMAMHETRR